MRRRRVSAPWCSYPAGLESALGEDSIPGKSRLVFQELQSHSVTTSVSVKSRTAGNVKCQYFSTNLNFYFEYYLVAENLTRFIVVYLTADHFSIFSTHFGAIHRYLGTLCWWPTSFCPVFLSGIESRQVSSLLIGIPLPGSGVITDP